MTTSIKVKQVWLLCGSGSQTRTGRAKLGCLLTTSPEIRWLPAATQNTEKQLAIAFFHL